MNARSLVLVLSDGRTAQYDLSPAVTVSSRISTIARSTWNQVQIRLPSPTSTWAERITVAGIASHNAELIRGRLGSTTWGRLVLTDVTLKQYLQLPQLPWKCRFGRAPLWHENRQIDLAAAAQHWGESM